MDAWFKDLVSNTKSLANLSRKVPVFNKKEEIFATLYEFSVPMFKATWVIKMSCAHQIAMSESNNKSKKRQLPDPSQEWTSFLCKFLKEHYIRTSESINTSMFTPIGSSLHLQPPPDTEELLKQWDYYVQVVKHMYDDNLLDRHDYLTWLLEMFEKIKSVDDPMLNLIVPMLVQYVDQFTESEFLSRRLSYYSAKKINQLVMEFNIELHSPDVDKENNSDSSTQIEREKSNSSPSSTPTKTPDPINSSLLVNGMINANLLSTCFREIVSCSRHRSILFSLCTIIQVVTLECPTALVWLNATTPSSYDSSSSKHSSSSVLQGSPLDMLPCEPSNLPMPPSDHNKRLRIHLRTIEEKIRNRSKLSEKKWFTEIFESVKSPKSVGNLVNRLLGVLDYLDRHIFEKVSSSNCVDSLYNKIFQPSTTQSTDHQSNSPNSENVSPDSPSGQSKLNSQLTDDDVATVRLLCEWAVTTKRSGEYRARVVARILERRQSELCVEKEQPQSESAVKESNTDTATSSDSTKMEVDESPSTEKEKTQTTSAPESTDSPATDPNTATETTTDSAPVFQEILFNYLDGYAPVFEDKTFGLYSFGSSNAANTSTENNKQAFHNLVLLFSELIRNDVFSHDLYMRALISRGQFSNPPNSALVSAASSNQSSKNSNDDLLTGLVPALTNIDTVSIANGKFSELC